MLYSIFGKLWKRFQNVRNPRTERIGREQARPVPGFFAGEIMKIMTQNADVLSEQKQTELLAQELLDQQITVLALTDGRQSSAELLVRSLEEQGRRCSWIWFSDHPDSNRCGTGTAFLCLDRDIRNVDRFALNKGQPIRKQAGHMALGIQIDGADDWFYCLSQDSAENIQEHWKLLNCCIVGKRLCSTVWLLGMQRYREEIGTSNWTEAADGEIWCSRKREIRTCLTDPDEKSHHYPKGASIIEVKE